MKSDIGSICFKNRVQGGDVVLLLSNRNGYQLNLGHYHSINLCHDNSLSFTFSALIRFSEKTLISPIQIAAASSRKYTTTF